MLNCVLIFLDISGGELIVIALVALLVLGPQKMGDFARKAGKMMNEVKRVSSEFTNQLNEETGSLQDEVHSIRDTLRGAANNIKDELTNTKQEVVKNLDTTSIPNINEPSLDVFNLQPNSPIQESQPESDADGVSSEQSVKQRVTKEEQTDINPTSKQENTTSP